MRDFPLFQKGTPCAVAKAGIGALADAVKNIQLTCGSLEASAPHIPCVLARCLPARAMLCAA
ncbi:MAG TPA: hypothetical protein VGJ84_12000, partial [Polyangiaceae bacterium]